MSLTKKIGLPTVDVIFQGMANTAVSRSQKGVACLIITDQTAGDKVKTYTSMTDVVTSEYTEENQKIIEDVFLSDVSKLHVIKIGSEETFDNAKVHITKDVNWVCFIAEGATEQKKLADFVKAENKTRVRRLKAVCHKLAAEAADDMHIVNFTNDTVTRIGKEAVKGHLYLGRLLGILAACRLDQSVTYKELVDLESVAEVSDADAAIDKGEFVLFNDDDAVRIGRGINSLQTNDKEHTEDMKYITIVEGMDLIYDDIVNTFKETYIGKFKNSYDNQVLLISAINSYFRSLAADEVLDPNYDNMVGVDVEKQREKWIENGKVEAELWTEKEVKNMTFRTSVFLTASIKFLNAIEDLTFIVEM